MKENIEAKYILGVDEVGRGPIAGPVCVCAFLLPFHEYDLFVSEALKILKVPIRDSKKLTKKQREKWFDFLQQQKTLKKCFFNVSFVSPLNIDKFGISKCIQKAVDESISKTYNSEIYSFFKLEHLLDKKDFYSNCRIVLDGGLRAPKEFENQETFIKGDENYPIISFASIVAKVSRDRVMEQFSKKYPKYGFEKNSGYGTFLHYKAIEKNGLSDIHRRSYIHKKIEK